MTKGKKNEPRKIDRWKPDDLNFCDNWTKKLSFSSPYDLERDLERLTESLKNSQTEPGLTPLEFILREFKDEAKKKLEENGLDSERLNDGWRTFLDPEDFSRLRRHLFDDFFDDSPCLLKPLEISMELQMAAHVALCVDRVRRDISKGDAQQTAIDMLKLCFTTVNANLHEMIVRGIRAKMAPAKGGRKAKKPEVFSLLAGYALKSSQKKDTLSLWKFLKEKLREAELSGKPILKGFDITFEQKEFKGAKRDVISYYPPGRKPKDLGFGPSNDTLLI